MNHENISNGDPNYLGSDLFLLTKVAHKKYFIRPCANKACPKHTLLITHMYT